MGSTAKDESPTGLMAARMHIVDGAHKANTGYTASAVMHLLQALDHTVQYLVTQQDTHNG